ncbi:unnamed protein product [Sphagnum troendelagicum]|uniref:Cytochrome c oxidase subunit 6b-1 n=1 Tax=Sphagnum troendelagicum TaxID=128251 RepID=A0ABP0U4Z9_9BRYO
MGTLTSLSHDCEVKEDDGEAQRQEKIESQVDVELHLDHHKQSPSNSVSVACELGCIPATAELQTTIFQQQLFEADDEDEDVVCGDYHDLSEYSDEEEEELSLQELRAVDDVKTAPMDYRFPTTNQAKHCYTRYNEFHKCAAEKGEDAKECKKYAKYYRSLCPGDWIDKWNEERENGTFPGRY